MMDCENCKHTRLEDLWGCTGGKVVLSTDQQETEECDKFELENK